jgi:hypothetical protein
MARDTVTVAKLNGRAFHLLGADRRTREPSILELT